MIELTKHFVFYIIGDQNVKRLIIGAQQNMGKDHKQMFTTEERQKSTF